MSYKKAIELIGSDEVDWKKTCILIAQSHPTIFVRYANTDIRALKERCAELVRAGQKINAIKEWRSATGDSLKDAKESVEALAA